MSKRKCKFTDDLSKKYPFIKVTKFESEVYCNSCSATFSIAHGGNSDIQKHLVTNKHKSKVRQLSAAASSSKVTSFFRNTEFGDKEKELAVAEGLFAFHTVCHNISFRSMDCTAKIIQRLFERKFTCSRTKAEAIVQKVLAPYAFTKLQTDLNNVSFISIFSDASNHKEIKLFPTLVRYFDQKSGINVKVIDFISLPGETADIICNSLLEILQKYNVADKLIAYCADNANTNFGGVSRKGENNIFCKMKKQLGHDIIGIGCNAHIVHNTIQTAADLLPVDVENIINKIYSYFYIYTVRVESLKVFCAENEIEYKKLLGYSKTRWLALLPAVERVLKLYSPLKSYFLSLEKCPVVLENFFCSEVSELWLKFIHNQASMFQNVIQKIEGENISVIEVAKQLNDLKIKCCERLDMGYVPLTLKNDLKNLEEQGLLDRQWFTSRIKNYYSTCVEYLNKWTVHMNEINSFH